LSLKQNIWKQTEAGEKENLRDERAKLYPSSDQDVGGQNAGSLANDSASSDNSTQEDQQDPNVSGGTTFAFGNANYSFAENGASTLDGESVSVTTTAQSFASGTEWFIVTANFSFNGVAGDVNMTIGNQSTGAGYFNETFNLVQDNTSRTATIAQYEAIDGDTIKAEVTNNTGSSAEIAVDISVDSIEEHSHVADSMNADSHDHNVLVTDAGHGGSGDASEHVISGQTAQKLINLLQEIDTSR